jgi:hypothetical protein
MATDFATGSTFCWGARHGLGLEVPSRLGTLRVAEGVRSCCGSARECALSNHSGPTPSRPAAPKAEGQVWRLHLAVAHARPAGGGRLTLWRVGHAAPHSVTISPRSDSAGRRFSCAKRSHRPASAACSRLMRASVALRASLTDSSARPRNHGALGCSSITTRPSVADIIPGPFGLSTLMQSRDGPDLGGAELARPVSNGQTAGG